VRVLQADGVSEQRACRIVGCARSTVRYRTIRVENPGLRPRMRELAARYRGFGYRKLCILARREGFATNHKRFHRIYREQGLAVLRHVRDAAIDAVTAPNLRWSINFSATAS